MKESMKAPLRQSPLYHVLSQLGASFEAYHGWQMASCFTSQNEENETLKTTVGISDVSWLGKIEIKGSQEYLDALTIAEGQVWNLARGHQFVACDPARNHEIARSVERQTTDRAAGSATEARCVHVIDVTSTYAGILLAGPRSRDVLQRLTAPDVSDAALPGGACLNAKVAGLHARVVRDDLDETLAYWLFVGTEYAAYAWEAIMHAGNQFSITPVGYEAVQGMRRSDG